MFLSEALRLPSTSVWVYVDLNRSSPAQSISGLPASVQHLDLLLSDPRMNYCWQDELSHLTGLHHLTSLELRLPKINSHVLQLLPRTLNHLSVDAPSAELESFAHFPSELSSLNVFYTSLVSPSGKSLPYRSIQESIGQVANFVYAQYAHRRCRKTSYKVETTS